MARFSIKFIYRNKIMPVLLIAGSPSERSRTAALLNEVGKKLEFRGAQVDEISLRQLPAQALFLADFAHPSLIAANQLVAQSDVIVVATPVYKAAYSGVLKVFLDVLSQTAFKGKTVLPIATGGSPHHMLALDYALRPVLQSLGAKHILSGIYATDAQVVISPEGGVLISEDIQARVEEAVNTLILEVIAPQISNAGRFASVPFKRVRESFSV
jgi:FMN reductase